MTILFDFIIKKNFDTLKKYIEDNIDIDLDIIDEHNNYFIHYLVNYNLIEIITYILKNRTIRLDIIDTDGRNILYIPIKYNYIELLNILVEFDKKSIGINIIDIRDNNGYSGLHYAIIFNNFKAVKILYQMNADINIIDNMKNNIYMIALQYKRDQSLFYLLENEFKKTLNVNMYLNNNNESILQSVIIYDDTNVLDFLIKHKNFIEMIVNNRESEYGLTALHQCVVLNKNSYAMKLLEYGGDINMSDYIGNTAIHYSIIEKNFIFIQNVIDMKYNILPTYNSTNLNGDTPLHLLLEIPDINVEITHKNKFQYDYLTILEVFVENTNMNIMNNMGITPLHMLVSKNLWTLDSIMKILTNGKTHMNLFISNRDNMTVIDMVPNNMKDQFIDMAVDSYYMILKHIKNKDNFNINWEKACANDDLENIIILYKQKTKKQMKDNTIVSYCKEYIREMITNMKRSVPQYEEIKLNIDSGIFKEGCFYTGSTIDILFGMIYLYKEYPNLDLVLEYPLTENKELESYYSKLGINYNYKLDFSNIEIIWSFQRLIFLTNFDSIFINKIDECIKEGKQFIVIPLGIEVATGSHANILIIDVVKETIERFEPNGKNSPRGFNYNSVLLDNILTSKFSHLLSKYTYIRPCQYLPDIGFQLLETLEDEKCKKIGDPNGFCAVWCVWWAEQRLRNSDILPIKLVDELINQIKLGKISFKNLIRNYSIKIIQIRDDFLKKYNLTINDWIVNNYTVNDIEMIEKDVINFLQ